MDCYSYLFPAGKIWIGASDGAVSAISWSPLAGVENKTPLIMRAAQQLDEYFAGCRTVFDLPLRAEGTEFRQRVWDILRTIPYGQTLTYGRIAQMLDSHSRTNLARAVGGACHNNPISIVIPCHRVLGAAGLTGYAGGLDTKRFLLELEGATPVISANMQKQGKLF